MNGLLVYEKEDAAQNPRFIELCIRAAQKRGLELRLVLTDELKDGLPQADFALLRTREPSLTRRFEQAGVRVFNSSILNETANNKMLTYDRLHDLVPMPTSYDGLCLDSPPFLPCVVKGARGCGGKNVYLAYDIPSYKAARESIFPDLPVVQPFVDAGRDLRIYVVGGKLACAMLRTSSADFRSNYKLGGSAKRVTPTGDELAIAMAVNKRFPIDYAGVDIIYDKGAPLLNEIEDPVGARMVYENTNIDIIDLLFSHIRGSV